MRSQLQTNALDKLIDVSLYGFETPEGTRDTSGRKKFTGKMDLYDDYASQVKRRRLFSI
jgi:hypothetical protein